MCPTVYLKTSKIDSCTPKVVFIIFMVRTLVLVVKLEPLC